MGFYPVNLFTDKDEVVLPSGTSTSIVARRSATQTQKRRSRSRKRRFDMEPMGGLEPPTCSLRIRGDDGDNASE